MMKASINDSFKPIITHQKVQPITKGKVYQIVYKHLIEQIPKKHIVDIVRAYSDVILNYVNTDFGWVIPGIASIVFTKQGSPKISSKNKPHLDHVDYFAYNDIRILKKIAQQTEFNYSIIDYVINDYFDTCIYLISRGYEPNIASIFYTRFLGNKKLVRLFPSSSLRQRAKELGLQVSVHSLLK